MMLDLSTELTVAVVTMIACFVCVQSALTIFEVRSAERAAVAVPAAFRTYVTLAEHRKAIDYSGEVIQADFISAIVATGIALLLTLGGGLTFLLAVIGTIWGHGIAAQCVLITAVSCLLALTDFPLAWWKEFRINERYGFEKTPSSSWIREQFKETLVGWLVQLPVLFGFLFVLNSCSYLWWLCAMTLTLGWFYWRIIIGPNWVVGFSASATPMPEGTVKSRLQALLAEQYWGEDIPIYHMPRPKNWKHGHALFARRLFHKRLVVFDHVLDNLNEDEVAAMAACAIARAARWHNAARLIFFCAITIGFWYALSLLSEQRFFYESLHIRADLALAGGSVNPALIVILAFTLVPIVLYPFVFVIHAFTRMLDFDEDAYAVRHVGLKPFIRAIVKLHRDYRTTLTPNRFYSLANHRRPHVTLRIQSAMVLAQEDKIRERRQLAENRKIHLKFEERQLALQHMTQDNLIATRKRHALRRQREMQNLHNHLRSPLHGSQHTTDL